MLPITKLLLNRLLYDLQYDIFHLFAKIKTYVGTYLILDFQPFKVINHFLSTFKGRN